jgi:hypothetical protein
MERIFRLIEGTLERNCVEVKEKKKKKKNLLVSSAVSDRKYEILGDVPKSQNLGYYSKRLC